MVLKRFGFCLVGRWQRTRRVRSRITFSLHGHADARVVYAFLIDDRVHYIGICERDGTTLRDRMRRYQGRQGAGTNARVATKIHRALKRGHVVEIVALKPPRSRRYRGLRVDLVKGLENPLIAKLKPKWNRFKNKPRSK